MAIVGGRGIGRLLIAALLVGGAAAGTWQGPARAANLSDADRIFLVEGAHGAAHELQSAKLTTTRGARQGAKAYAEELFQDHEKHRAALEKLGEGQRLTLPTEPGAAGQPPLEDLGEPGGKAFDELHVDEALRINAEDQQDGEKADTEDQAIEGFLAEFDDMDKTHEILAKQLEKANG